MADLAIGEARDLPEGWAWVRLATIAEFIGRGRGPSYVETGGIPVINQKCIRWRTIDSKYVKFTARAAFDRLPASLRLRAGDILWNSTGTGTIGRAAIYRGESGEITCDSHVTIVRLRACDPTYIAYLIETARVQHLVTEGNVGSTNQLELPRSFVEELPIPLPPLAEQKRIVARIDELFAEIAEGEAALNRAREGLETFRRALLKSAVTGELTREWREHAKFELTGSDIVSELRAEHPDEGTTRRSWSPSAKLPSIPDSWSWCAVSEAGDVQLGRQRAPQHHEGDHMRPYLRVANVLDDRLDLTDVKSMNFTPKEFETFALRFGDILLNEGQAPDLLGRPAMYRNEIPGCCFQKTLLRFRAKRRIDPEYALLVFRHYMHSGRFKRESRITTNIGHLTQVRFVEMEFPVPPVEEQQEIVARFQALNAGEETLSPLSSDAAQLRQAVLKAAFEGRLVPQDPDDEPASATLERLAATPTNVAPRRRGRPNRAER